MLQRNQFWFNNKGNQLLLDLYPNAAAAYSFRKLNSAYAGNCIRVRRSSDNAEQNIGFVGNVLDTASLISFVGANNGFVVTWYDQSGNGRNAINTTLIRQPQIVSSGTILTLNGKPRMNANAQYLSFSGYSSTTFNTFSVINAISVSSLSGYGGYLMNISNGNNGFKIVSYDTSTWFSEFIPYSGTTEQMTNARRRSAVKSIPTGQYLESWVYNNSAAQLYENNTSITVSSNVLSGWGNSEICAIGSMEFGGNYGGQFDHQEHIIYTSDQTSNLSDINSNINGYYVIY